MEEFYDRDMSHIRLLATKQLHTNLMVEWRNKRNQSPGIVQLHVLLINSKFNAQLANESLFVWQDLITISPVISHMECSHWDESWASLSNRQVFRSWPLELRALSVTPLSWSATLLCIRFSNLPLRDDAWLWILWWKGVPFCQGLDRLNMLIAVLETHHCFYDTAFATILTSM